ncbi:MAG: NUDIX domain-containing protein [Candidatus Pacebacteria bacterium]|nr:NUDIX domain-containing protein [Candidatus Paceibacterota bacterium]
MPSDRLNASLTVAVFVEEDEQLLMGQKRDTKEWGVPAGHILRGESPIEAAAREALEEMGTQISPYAFLGTFFVPREDGASICFGIRAFVRQGSKFVAKDRENLRIEWKSRGFVEYLLTSGGLYRPEYQAHNLMAWLSGERHPLWILHEIRVPWAK